MLDIELLKKRVNDRIESIKKYFAGDSKKLEQASAVAKRQSLNKILFIGFVFFSFFVFLLFLFSGSRDSDIRNLHDDKITEDHKKIELGGDATSSDIKWRNFLEESIESEAKQRQEQLDILKSSIENKETEKDKDLKTEFSEIKSRLGYVLNEIDRMRIDGKNLQQEFKEIKEIGEAIAPLELGITSIVEEAATKAPISSYNHIPATSYVSGHLLGGISVSTSVGSAGEPIPIIIKLTNRGSLPKDFAVDISQCRLLGSCYGDISSERAIIRAEELVCEDKAAGLITSTKVSGVIYGDDGANGIRGTVVSMSDKHLKNAFIGGVLSGFSGTAKGQSGFDITSVGAVSSKKKNYKEMARDGLLSGASNAAEKLADYHIKLAENISPVILVPGGTKVDVVFTKSVQIGSVDVEEVIASKRSGQ